MINFELFQPSGLVKYSQSKTWLKFNLHKIVNNLEKIQSLKSQIVIQAEVKSRKEVDVITI